MHPQWSVPVRPFVIAAVTMAVLTIPVGAAPANDNTAIGGVISQGSRPQGRSAPRNARLTGWDAAAVERARNGAAEKLQDPECQRVFTDFQDAEGRTIQENLEAWRMSPAEYLQIIPFVDGSGEKLCRSSRIALVATPNVRRVVVCPAFADLQLRQPREAESMIIHEILHTLGLGENPPTSIEITRRVESRCH